MHPYACGPYSLSGAIRRWFCRRGPLDACFALSRFVRERAARRRPRRGSLVGLDARGEFEPPPHGGGGRGADGGPEPGGFGNDGLGETLPPSGQTPPGATPPGSPAGGQPGSPTTAGPSLGGAGSDDESPDGSKPPRG